MLPPNLPNFLPSAHKEFNPGFSQKYTRALGHNVENNSYNIQNHPMVKKALESANPDTTETKDEIQRLFGSRSIQKIILDNKKPVFATKRQPMDKKELPCPNPNETETKEEIKRLLDSRSIKKTISDNEEPVYTIIKHPGFKSAFANTNPPTFETRSQIESLLFSIELHPKKLRDNNEHLVDDPTHFRNATAKFLRERSPPSVLEIITSFPDNQK